MEIVPWVQGVEPPELALRPQEEGQRQDCQQAGDLLDSHKVSVTKWLRALEQAAAGPGKPHDHASTSQLARQPICQEPSAHPKERQDDERLRPLLQVGLRLAPAN